MGDASAALPFPVILSCKPKASIAVSTSVRDDSPNPPFTELVAITERGISRRGWAQLALPIIPATQGSLARGRWLHA